MKKKTLLFAALIMIFAVQNISGADLEQLGITVLSSVKQDDGTMLSTIQDKETGFKFELSYKGTIDDGQIQLLSEVKKIIKSWKLISIQTLRVNFPNKKQLEISVIPRSFIFNGTDFAKYLPSGMQFYYSDLVEYDFRILVQKLTLRISGPYFTEQQLAEKLERAVKNPIAYMQSHDPEYMVRRMEEMTSLIDVLKGKEAAAEVRIQQLQDQLDSLTNAVQKKADDMLASLSGKIDDLEKSITAKLDEQKAAQDEQSAAQDETTKKMKLAVIAVANQGIFSSIKDFNKDAVDKAIALQQKNPSMTEDELVNACKEQGIKLTKKEAHLIITVYFSQF